MTHRMAGVLAVPLLLLALASHGGLFSANSQEFSTLAAASGNTTAAVYDASESSQFALKRIASPAAEIPSNGESLGNAERLSIHFQGRPELSADYRVSALGTIAIPIVGRFSVSNLTAPELERTLAGEVARISGREAYVSVQIAEYRPVYVIGLVSRPGSFAWRPGMTVLHAMALAGGMAMSTEPGGIAVDDLLVKLQKVIADQKRNLAALARYQAESDGSSTIATPSKLIDLVGKAEAAELIAAQSSLLTSRSAAHEAKKQAIVRARDMGQKELAGLIAQSDRLKLQLAARQDYKSRIDGLLKKGIVRMERSIDEFARVADLEDRSTSATVAIARVRSLLATLERDSLNLDYDRRAEIDDSINKLQREIAQLDIDLAAYRASYRKLTGHEPPYDLASNGLLKPVLNYEIVREGQAGATRLVCDQMTRVQPGDLLVVGLKETKTEARSPDPDCDITDDSSRTKPRS